MCDHRTERTVDPHDRPAHIRNHRSELGRHEGNRQRPQPRHDEQPHCATRGLKHKASEHKQHTQSNRTNPELEPQRGYSASTQGRLLRLHPLCHSRPRTLQKRSARQVARLSIFSLLVQTQCDPLPLVAKLSSAEPCAVRRLPRWPVGCFDHSAASSNFVDAAVVTADGFSSYLTVTRLCVYIFPRSSASRRLTPFV